MKYANIVLNRTDPRPLALELAQGDRERQDHRRSGSIILLDEAGQQVLRWNFVRGWPAKWEGPAINARASEVAIETLETTHEGLELEAG